MVSLFELDDHPSLDGDPPGVMDGEGGPRRFAMGVPPDRDQEIREAVEDRGLVHEALGAVDEPDDLEDLLDPVQGAELRLKLGETVEPRLPSRLVALLDGEVLTDHPPLR